jgi:drug/metabolite transporter (DMT)-like permease
MDSGRDRVALTAFLTVALLAGGNAVGIRFSNRELDPLWGAAMRFSLAALALLAAMIALRLVFPRGRALIGAVLYGVLQFGGAFAFAYYALVELHAGFAQILLAVVPLMTLFLAVAQRQEPFRLTALLGSVLAVIGVASMSRAPLQESLPVLSLLAALGSAACFAQAAIVVRGFPAVHPVTMNAVGMTAGAAALFAGSVLVGEAIDFPENAETWLALGYLVPLGTVAVFVLNIVVLGRWPASRFAYIFVLAPVVTVVLSAWLDDEPIGAELVLGGALVLGGVYVGALRD